MNKKARNIVALIGVISTITGVLVAAPSFLVENYLIGILGTFLLVFGLIFLAIAFGD